MQNTLIFSTFAGLKRKRFRMAYNKHIDKTEEELRELREVYAQDDVDRFIEGLESGQITTEEQVIEIINKIRKSDGLTLLELSRLRRLREGFIEKFATNYNKRFSTCHMLMNKMRSGISRGLKMLEGFCEKKRRKGHSKSKRKVVENSKMGHGEYRPSMWGLEHYKDSVKILYQEVSNYSNHLTECIDECLDMINKVEFVRNHPDEADRIYDKSYKETVLNSRTTIKRFIELNVDFENDIMKQMEEWERQNKSLKELKARLYHTLDENEWHDLCICEEVMMARRQGITNPERTLWGDNKMQVMRVRVAYEHIDELDLEGQKGKIDGVFMARLYRWSDTLPNRGLEYWHTYFVDTYPGKLTTKLSSVKMGRGKIAKMQDDKEQQTEFNQEVEELIKKYMVEPSDNINTISNAVNF